MAKLPKVEFKEFTEMDYKEKIEGFLLSLHGEQLTQAHEDLIQMRKQEFMDWLKKERLDYLLNPASEKTVFEWYVFDTICSVLRSFDSVLEQHDEVFGKPIDRINEQLRRAMTKFAKEYEDEFIIDKVYTNVGQPRRF